MLFTCGRSIDLSRVTNRSEMMTLEIHVNRLENSYNPVVV